MAITVIDSSNLDQIVADADPDREPPKPEPKAEPKTEAQAAEGGKGDKPPGEVENDADDVEGPDGLTPRQKREMSASMLKAVGKKHRQMKEAEEFAAALVRENAELKAKLPPVREAVEPKREAFATEDDFVAARIQWGIDQGIRQRDAEREEAARIERVGKRLEQAKEAVPDFETVTNANLNWPGPVASYMRNSEMFAELGYHFAKNPAELTRIANMRPEQQLVAVGKIEATLTPFGAAKAASKAEKDTPKGESGAHGATNGAAASSTLDTGFSPSKARSDAPVFRPLTTSEGQQVEPDVRDMNVREHIQAWQKDNKVDLQRRKRH